MSSVDVAYLINLPLFRVHSQWPIDIIIICDNTK